MTIAEPPTSESAFSRGAPAPAGVLDVANGAARLLGDRALYAQVLSRFRDDYRHSVAPVRGAIGNGDLELAERLAHTLKGAAGLIGAPSLYLQASLLELALRNRAPGQDEAVAMVERALDEVLGAIGRELGTEQRTGTPAPPRPSAPDRSPVAQLAGLLDRGDGAALDVLDGSRASLAAALGEPGFAEVARAANRFDFEAALDALRRAAEASGQA